MKIVAQVLVNFTKILISRRNFLLFFPLFIACCKRENTQLNLAPRKIALGHASKFSQGLNPFPLQRLLVVREAQQLRALSLVCTHQYCALRVSESALLCPCHAASFDFQGKVLSGPAKQDLPHYQLELDLNGVISADLNVEVDSNWRLTLAKTTLDGAI